MDQELSPRKSLELAVVEYLDEQYPYWQGDPSRVPSQLRIEMHPITRLRLLHDPDIAYTVKPGVFDKLTIPVNISLDMQPGEWRLIHVTVDVKIAGMLP